MSEPRCECERVREALRNKSMTSPIECCPLHPLTVPASPGNVSIGLAFSLDEDTLQLCFSEPVAAYSLPLDVARALGAAMIRAADLLDQGPPQRPQ